MREFETEVTIVGAGPVGLVTALLLAKEGIDVRIVDRASRPAARSYACALHPSAVRLLRTLGLGDGLAAFGRRLGTMAFYEGNQRRAEINLSELDREFPYLLVVAQDVLEGVLEQELRKAGVGVAWGHRFDRLDAKGDRVDVVVEALGGTAVGYIVPHWEEVVEDQLLIHTRVLVGCDGAHSTVRQRLEVPLVQVSGPEYFAAYEFQTDSPGEDEVRVVLDKATTNVLWPLGGNRRRWTFQVPDSNLEEFPAKERRAVRVAHAAVDEQVRAYAEKVAHERAPWFSAPVKTITWSTEVVFEQRYASEFGRGGCWLAGDAAHQTGPVGAQSMNIGFREASALAEGIKQALHGGSSKPRLDRYNAERLEEWRQMLGVSGGLQPRTGTDPWLAARASRILPCLPCSRAELPGIARQLGFDLARRPELSPK